MKILVSTLKYFINEFVIIFCLIFLINNYIGKADKRIGADEVGYYEYLPSIFIHHDFVRKNDSVHQNPNLYHRINSINGVYVDYKGYKVNKYSGGTAFLQLPFFAYTCLTSKLDGNFNDGYQSAFQKSFYYIAIFYLFLSILFLKKLLVLYDIKKHIIFFSQLILVLATSVTNYVNYDAGFSHIYSLFAITAFLYFIKSFIKYQKMNHFVWASVFLGLIFILRQPNILIVFFIPFLAASVENLKISFATLFKNTRDLLLSILLFFAVISIQFVFWYLQTGDFYVYSYQGESFNFLDPHFFSILFSYKKGLFVYTPVLFIASLSLIWFAYKKQFYLFFTWIGFFVLLTYLLSSWWSWFYGCSYGLRAYIDFYVIFLIPFALMLDKLGKVSKLLIMGLSLFTIPLNIIQTYQFKEYILHWIDMDKEKYWKVFLKTDNQYKGLLFKNNFDKNQYYTVKEITIGDISSPENSVTRVLKISSSAIPDFDKSSIIQIFIDNEYQETNQTKISLSINKLNESHNYYWHERYLIHFHQTKLNEWQTGLFNFDFEPITDHQEVEILLDVITANQREHLKNVRLKILNKK